MFARHESVTNVTVLSQDHLRDPMCWNQKKSGNDPHHRVAPSDANKFVNPRVRLRCMRLFGTGQVYRGNY